MTSTKKAPVSRVKLQTVNRNRFNMKVTVNGRTYRTDSSGVIDNLLPVDGEKLLSLGEGWREPLPVLGQRDGAPKSAADLVTLCASDAHTRDTVSSFRSFTMLQAWALRNGFRFTQAEYRAAVEADAIARDTNAPAPSAPLRGEKARGDVTRAAAADEAEKALAAQADLPDELNPRVPIASGNGDVGMDDPDGVGAAIDDELNVNEDGDISPEEAEAQVAAAAAAAEEAAAGETVPGEGEDWPDPEMTHSKGFLQKMADAYGVKYDAATTKKSLITKIKAEMYPQE